MLSKEVIKMPPVKKYSKEEIIEVTYELIKNEGLGAVNARRIASILGCSVQPIFHNFTSMEDLNNFVLEKIYNKYKEYMINGRNCNTSPYKQMGLAYIKFAKDYPEFFKLLFMKQTNLNAENVILNDDLGNDVIKTGQQLTGLDAKEQSQFHVKVWIFTHGIACMVATKTVDFTDSEIEKLLEESVRQMLIGYYKEKGENK